MRFVSLWPLFAAVSGSVFASLDERQAVSSAVVSGGPSSTSVFAAPTAEPAAGINSVYADGKIYIDGGNTYVPKANNTFYNTQAGAFTSGMHTQLLVLDLSKNFTNQETGPYSSIWKAPDVPNGLIEHAMWFSQTTRKVYQLGGWWSSNNNENPAYIDDFPEPAIWEFDIDTERWAMSTDFEVSNNDQIVDRPGAAAFCDAPTLNRSYIFEGYTQRRSSPANSQYSPSLDFRFLEGMLELDTADKSQPKLTNISVPTYVGPRMNGAMVHVPAGEKGIIVNIGGQTTRDETEFGIRIDEAASGNININQSFVDIYDIETGFWFRQETFGLPDMPTGRSDICAVLVPAKDSSSWNIYMIAGVENYATYITSEEIWVLTLPTFNWILVHTRADGMYGHTCHAVGENLLIVGGMQTKSDGSGGNVQTCSEHMPAEIFSLVSLNYTGKHDTEAAKRLAPVPEQVVKAIWRDRPAYTPTYTLVVQPTAATNSTTPAPTSSPNGTSKGAIVGGVVGGVLGAIALVGAGIFAVILRRRKKRKAAAELAAAENSRQSAAFSELPGYTPYSSPEPKPGFATSPTASPGPQAAELEVPNSVSEMPSSPRYGGSVEMGSDATQSPVSPTLGPGGQGYEGGRGGRSPTGR
ncbi:cell wall anchored protein [Colletotrichum kahawae]|uniref:Cell wall anchored protein n=1 Tax=Colletotrichum kahawae TaxID=34407 RepID=A0AAE0DAN9_COLKA|nr:cell wall anchored protein [Colletotrichum kahawae]